MAASFNDIDCHGGDGMGGIDRDGTDWTATVGMTQVLWTTDSFETNENANAPRWGTLYNFRLTADTPPRARTTPGDSFNARTPAPVSGGALVPRSSVRRRRSPRPAARSASRAPAPTTWVSGAGMKGSPPAPWSH